MDVVSCAGSVPTARSMYSSMNESIYAMRTPLEAERHACLRGAGGMRPREG